MPQAMRPWTSVFVASDALSWEGIPGWIRYSMAFVIPLLATLALTPVAGRLAGRFDVIDHPGAHKTHEALRRISVAWRWPPGFWSSAGSPRERTVNCLSS